MEAKNLNDQNPEIADLAQSQEEKPQAGEKTASVKKNAKSAPKVSQKTARQIAAQEKKMISRQVASQIMESKVLSSDPEEKKPQFQPKSMRPCIIRSWRC